MMADDATVILVCGLVDGPLYLPDNLVGRCYECRRQVQYRPHAPKNHILRCLGCAVDMIGPDDTVEVPPQMLDDARKYWRKRRH
jgi:hypothetical protein